MQSRVPGSVIGVLVLAIAAGVAYVGGYLPNMDSASSVCTGTVVDQNTPLPEGLARATFGGGCFWCTEAVFLQLRGVRGVVSGYSGGHVVNPTYRQVCSASTGHAEVIQVTYDPKEISFTDLLEVFWQTHDPTTLNRQGNDVGPQYRSVIFWHDEEQRRQAEAYKQQLEAATTFPRPIVTELAPFTVFYPAEDYHQAYFAQNSGQPYCTFVVRPKVEKFRKAFAEKLRS